MHTHTVLLFIRTRGWEFFLLLIDGLVGWLIGGLVGWLVCLLICLFG